MVINIEILMELSDLPWNGSTFQSKSLKKKTLSWTD